MRPQKVKFILNPTKKVRIVEIPEYLWRLDKALDIIGKPKDFKITNFYEDTYGFTINEYNELATSVFNRQKMTAQGMKYLVAGAGLRVSKEEKKMGISRKIELEYEIL